jgi:hypothetical protein
MTYALWKKEKQLVANYRGREVSYKGTLETTKCSKPLQSVRCASTVNMTTETRRDL